MSKVQIEIPDDRWLRGEWQIRPQDKQLCIALMKDDLFPMIYVNGIKELTAETEFPEGILLMYLR